MLGFSRTSVLGRTDTQTTDNLMVQIANRQRRHLSPNVVKRSNHSI